MKFFSVRSVFFILLSSLIFVIPPKLLASKDSSDREVRVTYVQGDVRLSRGDSRGVNLKKPWEQAQSGELVQEGFALATGRDGRAEVEFENGSTVYLAENSLLLFTELGFGFALKGDAMEVYRILILAKIYARPTTAVSHMTLATGTATLALQPGKNDAFYLDTPTDRMGLSFPETLFARIDAYLDATTVTAQGDKGEELHRPGLPPLHIEKGQSFFIRDGETLELHGPLSRIQEIEAAGAAFGMLGFSPPIDKELALQDVPNDQIKTGRSAVSSESVEPAQTSAAVSSQMADHREWDSWVSTRVREKGAVMTAALQASGLATPIPGLADLYRNGRFFDCEPYGKCWEATSQDSLEKDPIVGELQQSSGGASPAPGQATGTFQPQTVQWQERWADWSEPCGTGIILKTVSHTARTPEELQKLLRKKEAAERARLGSLPYLDSNCRGYWIPHRGHFARILTPQAFNAKPVKCPGKECKPIHPPRPLWVKVNGKVGFVPAHPNDVKGKPPLNLNHGVFLPPAKPGDPVLRMDVDSSRKVAVLDKAPREFRSESNLQGTHVSAPEIHAHFLQEATAWNKSLPGSARAHPSITYDYKSGHFLMAGSSFGGARSHEVAVGGISSHGSTYSGGGHGYGEGHSSGGSYSGSYSSGSHSGGSGSYSGGTSHSSSGSVGGSSSSSSSSGSSSSSSSSSSGGGSRGRP